jgi:hypothetical protein
MNRVARSVAGQNLIEHSAAESGKQRCSAVGDQLEISLMKLFRKRQPSVQWCLPLLLLSGCGDVGPDCATPSARNSVLKSVADDRNNRLLNFAIDNSDSVAELMSHAKADTEKAAIKDKAKQDAVYSLDDTVVVNSKNKGATLCTGLLYVRVGDTTVQKEIDFRVEQAADGKVSVSVTPFQF